MTIDEFREQLEAARLERITHAWQLVQDLIAGTVPDLATAQARAQVMSTNYNEQLLAIVEALASDSALDFFVLHA